MDLMLMFVCFMFACSRGGFVVSTGGGFCVGGFLLVWLGPRVSSVVMMLRGCAFGDGFQALHWNMLSCLWAWVGVLRCLAVVCILWGDVGG